MTRSPRRFDFALVVLIALLCAPLIALGLYVVDKHQWAQQRIAELEPRHARLAGLELSRDALTKAEAAARERVAEYVYPAGEDLTQAGNDAQQRIRTVFTNAGLQVVSSQVLPAKDEKQFDRIPLIVRLEGDLAGVQSALIALSRQSPAILIDGLRINTIGIGRADAAPPLGSQFNLSVLRAKP